MRLIANIVGFCQNQLGKYRIFNVFGFYLVVNIFERRPNIGITPVPQKNPQIELSVLSTFSIFWQAHYTTVYLTPECVNTLHGFLTLTPAFYGSLLINYKFIWLFMCLLR